MSTTRTVRRTPRTGVLAKFRQYVALGQEAKAINKRANDLKTDLRDFVVANHEVDPEKGHLNYFFDEPVDVGGIRYLGFQQQRKVTQVFHEDKAEALCQRLGLDPDEYTTRVIDQDKIVRLYADEKITDKQFNSLYADEESWAFCLVKG